jgi:hypothetical protein
MIIYRPIAPLTTGRPGLKSALAAMALTAVLGTAWQDSNDSSVGPGPHRGNGADRIARREWPDLIVSTTAPARRTGASDAPAKGSPTATTTVGLPAVVHSRLVPLPYGADEPPSEARTACLDAV